MNNENNIKNFFKAKRKQIKNHSMCQMLRFSQFIPLKPGPKAIFNCNTIY